MEKYKMTGFQKVKQFCRTFGHACRNTATQIDETTSRLRLTLIVEETAEVVGAYIGNAQHKHHLKAAQEHILIAEKLIQEAQNYEFLDIDLENLAKELTDVNYVVYGAGAAFGLNLDECMAAVHTSNMSKLNDDGRPEFNDIGKVVKGGNYKEPDIAGIIFPEPLVGFHNDPSYKGGSVKDGQFTGELEGKEIFAPLKNTNKVYTGKGKIKDRNAPTKEDK